MCQIIYKLVIRNQKLKNAYFNSLKLVKENNCKTIAFPGISTGIYKFSKDRAIKIALSTITDFLNSTDSIEEVTLVCFDDENFRIVNKELVCKS